MSVASTEFSVALHELATREHERMIATEKNEDAASAVLVALLTEAALVGIAMGLSASEFGRAAAYAHVLAQKLGTSAEDK